MFPYDPALLKIVQSTPRSVSEVLGILDAIGAICVDVDGLKWFNGLYTEVTRAVKARVDAKGFTDPGWIANLDVHFARLYFSAIRSSLSGQPTPGCWEILMTRRNQRAVARIQFTLAGMNSHINHDLPQAIVSTCRETKMTPTHGGVHYGDYTAINATLSGLIESAKKTLMVRLPGDPLPLVSHLEDTIAAWKVSAARESAWLVSEDLWRLHSLPPLAASVVNTLDGFTTVINKALLVPVPL
jgi:hypothetical protein